MKFEIECPKEECIIKDGYICEPCYAKFKKHISDQGLGLEETKVTDWSTTDKKGCSVITYEVLTGTE